MASPESHTLRPKLETTDSELYSRFGFIGVACYAKPHCKKRDKSAIDMHLSL